MRSTFLLLFFAAPAFAQSTWYVDADGTAPGTGSAATPYTSIQYAIDHSSTIAGDRILVLPGTYFENVNFRGKVIELKGLGNTSDTIVDGAGAGPVVTINVGTGSPMLQGFTLTHGSNFVGGGLCASPPIKRTPPMNSAGNPPPNDCSGMLTFDFNARIQSGIDPGLAIATTVYAQYYYRDPPASFGVGLSNAIAFTICP